MKILTILIALIMSLTLVSAATINSINADVLTPGKEGTIRVVVENTLDEDLEDISVNLIFKGTPFTPVGSSEKSVDEIGEGDEDDFSFRLRAANEVKPGNYEISYVLKYNEKGSSTVKTSEGTIGVRVSGNPDLVFTISGENAVESQQGKIVLKIVNKGFSDARFVSVKIISTDFILLSEEQIYIGTVDSDDFETADFNVLFDRNPARFKAIVEYKDFDNKDAAETVDLPLNIYSKEEALKLGITKKSKSPVVLAGAVMLLALFFVWRTVKRRRNFKRSLNRN
ncbi:MAG TPA: hypothetical protein VJI98_02475 [Candidatus Nanoarchaeia archaeon]|nr:hypothetical protein [Candidatus Nanoarchaeia archaeon]